jgi:hypothetical protein
MPKNMGKMPMRLMGETPMLRRMAFFNGLLGIDGGQAGSYVSLPVGDARRCKKKKPGYSDIRRG